MRAASLVPSFNGINAWSMRRTARGNDVTIKTILQPMSGRSIQSHDRPPGEYPAPSRTVEEYRHISRLMLFFAIVYAVEGIGQARVGIIFLPLNNYLKVTGWTPAQVT